MNPKPTPHTLLSRGGCESNPLAQPSGSPLLRRT